MKSHSKDVVPLACLLVVLVAVAPARNALAQPGAQASRLHALAVDKFRHGRFPEAYGRFVDLANAGHAPSAAVALWMCAQGTALFGSAWDCTAEEVADWTRLSRSAACPPFVSTLPATAPSGARPITMPPGQAARQASDVRR